MRSPLRFVHDEQALKNELAALKQMRCPHCKRSGTFNVHDRLRGNRPDHASERQERGRRAWCSTRAGHGGCGRTVKILFARTLPRHTLTAPMIWAILQSLLDGLSAKAATDKLRTLLCAESIYRFLKRLRGRLDVLRTALLNRSPPPDSEVSDPLLQTVQHMRCAFPSAPCPIEAFQMVFQRPLMG